MLNRSSFHSVKVSTDGEDDVDMNEPPKPPKGRGAAEAAISAAGRFLANNKKGIENAHHKEILSQMRHTPEANFEKSAITKM